MSETQSLFDLAVQLERDVTEAQADEAYRIVTQALRERGFRFAAQLRIIPEQPKAEVRSSMNTLWTGGDLGG